MRSIPLAMTWEMLYRGRWSLIAGLLGANALPALIMTALAAEGPLDPEHPSQILMHLLLIQICMLVFASALFTAQGHPSRLYAFPVSASTLAACHLFPAMAAVAIAAVVNSAVLNLVFQLHWPLWGPALFAAVAIAVVQAALWLTEKSTWIFFVFALVGATLGLWFKSRYGEVFSLPIRYWTEITPADGLTMLAAVVLAYSLAVVGIARNRRGEPLPSLGIMARLARLFDSAPIVSLPLRTPADAQFWFEWTKKGWFMPVAVVFGMLTGLAIWLIFNRDGNELFQGFVVGGGMVSVAGFVGGVVLGNSGPNDSNFEMAQFLATRPMTNADMARIVLKVLVKSVFLAWITWAAAFLALYLILLVTQVVPAPALPKELGWWYFPATFLGAWIVAALIASAGLTGRSGPLMILLCGSFATWIGLMLLSKYALSREAQAQLFGGVMIVLAVIFALGTAWAFLAAFRRSLIGSTTLVLALSAWLLLGILVGLEWMLHPTVPILRYVFVVGLSALVVAPLATAPLALAWNRNR